MGHARSPSAGSAATSKLREEHVLGPGPRLWTTARCGLSALLHPAFGRVEQLVVQLGEPVRRERTAVCALEVLEHPLLARKVDEADAVLLFVVLQLGDEP